MEPDVVNPMEPPAPPTWLDAGLAALGLPDATTSAAVVVACALASVTLTEIAKNAAPRPDGVDSARWQWTWRLVAVACATLIGVALSSLGRVHLHEGALLGLCGGLAAPVIWRVAIPYLRGRGR
jgi:hypothetical protein